MSDAARARDGRAPGVPGVDAGEASYVTGYPKKGLRIDIAEGTEGSEGIWNVYDGSGTSGVVMSTKCVL